jgi:hypothetical protein
MDLGKFAWGECIARVTRNASHKFPQLPPPEKGLGAMRRQALAQ